MGFAEIQGSAKLDHREVGRYWNENAEAWTALSRDGHDTWRDLFNTPAFLDALPDVTGLRGLDIGCGEGANTRSVAKRGARLTAFDISPRFVRHARGHEESAALAIRHVVASAIELPFPDTTFDFAVSFMCLMDMPDSAGALTEVFRVLRPGSFFQFSVLHPIMVTPGIQRLSDSDGRLRGHEIGNYFDVATPWIDEWIFRYEPADKGARFTPFRTPYFNRTISGWINAVIAAGFVLDYVGEPRPDDAAVARDPSLRAAQLLPAFLHLRGIKPALQR